MPPRYQLTITEVVRETPDAATLVFEPPPSGAPLVYQPGQFLTVRVPDSGAGSVGRCYSLCSSPATDARPAITVKRVSGGTASNWLCDNAIPGLVLDCLAPRGTFTPQDWDRNFLLFAAGSGITPIMSILKTALHDHGNSLTLVYANRDHESTIFASQLAELEHRHPSRFTVYYMRECESGLPNPDALAARLTSIPVNDRHDAYLCGPEPFMDAAAAALQVSNMATSRIHREKFQSLTSNPFSYADRASEPRPEEKDLCTVRATVDIAGDRHELEWPRESRLLDLLLDQEIDAPYACREGSCGACAFTLISGEVKLLSNDTLDSYELEQGVRLACQSVPLTDDVEIEFN
ncbi:ferredoxin--NADP reductase [Hoyosella subflava]|uniref:Oxidoreductase FAD-binding domain protein n=1 Tax=Hoyosella subflava (strain DSM 45089 / JCM 17490 / NBRC 109087 / DQS3-9A1) TaxID=443218 RepID=F6EER6_HOYSD|nr:ferredoxin--NADP reductase [Hoyosella subflava]AEF40866.1 Oxidoreductase FAD-binding domain protein [Hoyosella subflava DQS3-9A1]